MMEIGVTIISDGLIQAGSEYALHPALAPWGKALNRCRRTWFSCADKTPLEWYAAMANAMPAALLASKCTGIPADVKQCWIASPYCGQLGRDTVRVMPEGVFSWHADDAQWLCDVLNPLLQEDGMHLLHVGEALLLVCSEPLRVRPQSFAMIAGKNLPNQHPEGEDGGRFMRLMAEIQMVLHGRHASPSGGRVEIHGLWFWGGCAWPMSVPDALPAVATRNPLLHAVTDGAAANIMITEAERLETLLKQRGDLPTNVVLAGEGMAVLLTKSLLPKWGNPTWMPRSAHDEAELLSVLQSALL